VLRGFEPDVSQSYHNQVFHSEPPPRTRLYTHPESLRILVGHARPVCVSIVRFPERGRAFRADRTAARSGVPLRSWPWPTKRARPLGSGSAKTGNPSGRWIQPRLFAGAVSAYTDRSSEAKGAAALRCRQLDGRAAILVVARPGGFDLDRPDQWTARTSFVCRPDVTTCARNGTARSQSDDWRGSSPCGARPRFHSTSRLSAGQISPSRHSSAA